MRQLLSNDRQHGEGDTVNIGGSTRGQQQQLPHKAKAPAIACAAAPPALPLMEEAVRVVAAHGTAEGREAIKEGAATAAAARVADAAPTDLVPAAKTNADELLEAEAPVTLTAAGVGEVGTAARATTAGTEPEAAAAGRASIALAREDAAEETTALTASARVGAAAAASSTGALPPAIAGQVEKAANLLTQSNPARSDEDTHTQFWGESPFRTFPLECLYVIFSFLDLGEVPLLRLVSREFRAAVDAPAALLDCWTLTLTSAVASDASSPSFHAALRFLPTLRDSRSPQHLHSQCCVQRQQQHVCAEQQLQSQCFHQQRQEQHHAVAQQQWQRRCCPQQLPGQHGCCQQPCNGPQPQRRRHSCEQQQQQRPTSIQAQHEQGDIDWRQQQPKHCGVCCRHRQQQYSHWSPGFHELQQKKSERQCKKGPQHCSEKLYLCSRQQGLSNRQQHHRVSLVQQANGEQQQQGVQHGKQQSHQSLLCQQQEETSRRSELYRSSFWKNLLLRRPHLRRLVICREALPSLCSVVSSSPSYNTISDSSYVSPTDRTDDYRNSLTRSSTDDRFTSKEGGGNSSSSSTDEYQYSGRLLLLLRLIRHNAPVLQHLKVTSPDLQCRQPVDCSVRTSQYQSVECSVRTSKGNSAGALPSCLSSEGAPLIAASDDTIAAEVLPLSPEQPSYNAEQQRPQAQQYSQQHPTSQLAQQQEQGRQVHRHRQRMQQDQQQQGKAQQDKLLPNARQPQQQQQAQSPPSAPANCCRWKAQDLPKNAEETGAGAVRYEDERGVLLSRWSLHRTPTETTTSPTAPAASLLPHAGAGENSASYGNGTAKPGATGQGEKAETAPIAVEALACSCRDAETGTGTTKGLASSAAKSATLNAGAPAPQIDATSPPARPGRLLSSFFRAANQARCTSCACAVPCKSLPQKHGTTDMVYCHPSMEKICVPNLACCSQAPFPPALVQRCTDRLHTYSAVAPLPSAQDGSAEEKDQGKAHRSQHRGQQGEPLSQQRGNPQHTFLRKEQPAAPQFRLPPSPQQQQPLTQQQQQQQQAGLLSHQRKPPQNVLVQQPPPDASQHLQKRSPRQRQLLEKQQQQRQQPYAPQKPQQREQCQQHACVHPPPGYASSSFHLEPQQSADARTHSDMRPLQQQGQLDREQVQLQSSEQLLQHWQRCQREQPKAVQPSISSTSALLQQNCSAITAEPLLCHPSSCASGGDFTATPRAGLLTRRPLVLGHRLATPIGASNTSSQIGVEAAAAPTSRGTVAPHLTAAPSSVSDRHVDGVAGRLAVACAQPADAGDLPPGDGGPAPCASVYSAGASVAEVADVSDDASASASTSAAADDATHTQRITLPASVGIVVTGESIHFQQLRTVQLLGCQSFYWLQLLFSRCSLPRCVEFSLVSKCLAVHTPRAVPHLPHLCSAATVAAPATNTTTVAPPPSSSSSSTTTTTNAVTPTNCIPFATSTGGSAVAIASPTPMKSVTASFCAASDGKPSSAEVSASLLTAVDQVATADPALDGGLPSETAAALAGSADVAAATPSRNGDVQAAATSASAGVVASLSASRAVSVLASGVTIPVTADLTPSASKCHRRPVGTLHEISADLYRDSEKSASSAAVASHIGALERSAMPGGAIDGAAAPDLHETAAGSAARTVVTDVASVYVATATTAAESSFVYIVNGDMSYNHPAATPRDRAAPHRCPSRTNSLVSRELFGAAAPVHAKLSSTSRSSAKKQTCSISCVAATPAAASGAAKAPVAALPVTAPVVVDAVVSRVAAAVQCHTAEVSNGPMLRENEVTDALASDCITFEGDTPFAAGELNEVHASSSLSSTSPPSSGAAVVSLARREASAAAAEVLHNARVGNTFLPSATRFDDDLVRMLGSAPRLRVLRLETSIPVGRTVWKALLAGCGGSSKRDSEVSSYNEYDGRTAGPAIDSRDDSPESRKTSIPDTSTRRNICTSSSSDIRSKNIGTRNTSSRFISSTNTIGRSLSSGSISARSHIRNHSSCGRESSSSSNNSTDGCLCPFLEDLTITDRSVPPLVEVLRTLQNAPPAAGIPAATAAAAARLAWLEDGQQQPSFRDYCSVAAAATEPTASEQDGGAASVETVLLPGLTMQREAQAGTCDCNIVATPQTPRAFVPAAAPPAATSAIDAATASSVRAAPAAANSLVTQVTSEGTVPLATLRSPISPPVHYFTAASTTVTAAVAHSSSLTREASEKPEVRLAKSARSNSDTPEPPGATATLVIPGMAAEKAAAAGTAGEGQRRRGCYNSSESRGSVASIEEQETHALNSYSTSETALSTAIALPLTASLLSRASPLSENLEANTVRRAVDSIVAFADKYVSDISPVAFVPSSVSAVDLPFSPSPRSATAAQGENADLPAATTLSEAPTVVSGLSVSPGAYPVTTHAEYAPSLLFDPAFSATVLSTNAAVAKPSALGPSAGVAASAATGPSGLVPAAFPAAAAAACPPTPVPPEDDAAAVPPDRVRPAFAVPAAAAPVNLSSRSMYNSRTAFSDEKCSSRCIPCPGMPNRQERSPLLLWGRRGLTLALRRSRIGGLEKWGQRLPAVLLESLQQLVLSCAPSCEICLDALAATSSSTSIRSSSRRNTDRSDSNALGRAGTLNSSSSSSDRHFRGSSSSRLRVESSSTTNRRKQGKSDGTTGFPVVANGSSSIYKRSHKTPNESSTDVLNIGEEVQARYSSVTECQGCSNSRLSSWKFSSYSEGLYSRKKRQIKTSSPSSTIMGNSNICSSKKCLTSSENKNDSSRNTTSISTSRSSCSLNYHTSNDISVTESTSPFCRGGSRSPRTSISDSESSTFSYSVRRQRVSNTTRRRRASSRGSMWDDSRRRTIGHLCCRHRKRRRKVEGHYSSSRSTNSNNSKRASRNTRHYLCSRESVETRIRQGTVLIRGRETSTNKNSTRQQNKFKKPHSSDIVHRRPVALLPPSQPGDARNDRTIAKTSNIAACLPGKTAGEVRIPVSSDEAAALTSPPAAETAIPGIVTDMISSSIAKRRAPNSEERVPLNAASANGFGLHQQVTTIGSNEAAAGNNNAGRAAATEKVKPSPGAAFNSLKGKVAGISPTSDAAYCSCTKAGKRAALAALTSACSGGTPSPVHQGLNALGTYSVNFASEACGASGAGVAAVPATSAFLTTAPTNPLRGVRRRSLLPIAHVAAQEREETDTTGTAVYGNETETAAAAAATALERSLLQLRCLRLVYDDPENDICFTSYQRGIAQRHQQQDRQWPQRQTQRSGMDQQQRRTRRKPRSMSRQRHQGRERQTLRYNMSRLQEQQQQQGEPKKSCNISLPSAGQTPRFLSGGLQKHMQGPGERALHTAALSSHLVQQVQPQQSEIQALQQQLFQKIEGEKRAVDPQSKNWQLHLEQPQSVEGPGTVPWSDQLLIDGQQLILQSQQWQHQRHTVQQAAKQCPEAESVRSAEEYDYDQERLQSQRRLSRLVLQNIATTRLRRHSELRKDQGGLMEKQQIPQQQQLQPQPQGQRQRVHSEEQRQKSSLLPQQGVQQQQQIEHHKQQQRLQEQVSARSVEDVIFPALYGIGKGDFLHLERSNRIWDAWSGEGSGAVCSHVSVNSYSHSRAGVRDTLNAGAYGKKGSNPGVSCAREDAACYTADEGEEQDSHGLWSPLCCSEQRMNLRRGSEKRSINWKRGKSGARRRSSNSSSSSHRDRYLKRRLCNPYGGSKSYGYCSSNRKDCSRHSTNACAEKRVARARHIRSCGMRRKLRYIKGKLICSSRRRAKDIQRRCFPKSTGYSSDANCQRTRNNDGVVPRLSSRSSKTAERTGPLKGRENIHEIMYTWRKRSTATSHTHSQAASNGASSTSSSEVRRVVAPGISLPAAAAEVLATSLITQEAGERNSSVVTGGTCAAAAAPGTYRRAGHIDGTEWRASSPRRQRKRGVGCREQAEEDEGNDREELLESKGRHRKEAAGVEETRGLQRGKTAARKKSDVSGAVLGSKEDGQHKRPVEEGLAKKVDRRKENTSEDFGKDETQAAEQPGEEGKEEHDKAIKEISRETEEQEEEQHSREDRAYATKRKRKRRGWDVVKEEGERGNDDGKLVQGAQSIVGARERASSNFQQPRERRTRSERNEGVERQVQQRAERGRRAKEARLEKGQRELQATKAVALEGKKQETDRRERQEQQNEESEEEEELLLLPHLQRLSIDFFHFSPHIHRNIFRCRFGAAAVARATATKRRFRTTHTSPGTAARAPRAPTVPAAKIAVAATAGTAIPSATGAATALTAAVQGGSVPAAVLASAHLWDGCSSRENCRESSSERSDWDSDSSVDYTCPSFCIEGFPFLPVSSSPTTSSRSAAPSTCSSPKNAAAVLSAAPSAVVHRNSVAAIRTGSPAPPTSASAQAAGRSLRPCDTVALTVPTSHDACTTGSTTHRAAPAAAAIPRALAETRPNATSSTAAVSVSAPSTSPLACRLSAHASSFFPPSSVSSFSLPPAKLSLPSATAQPSVADFLEASVLPLLRSPAFASFVLVLQPHPTGFQFSASAGISFLKGSAPVHTPAADFSNPAAQVASTDFLFPSLFCRESTSTSSAAESSVIVDATAAPGTPPNTPAFPAKAFASPTGALASPAKTTASPASVPASSVGAPASLTHAPAALADSPASSAGSFSQLKGTNKCSTKGDSNRVAGVARSIPNCCRSSGSPNKIKNNEQSSRPDSFCLHKDSRSTGRNSGSDSPCGLSLERSRPKVNKTLKPGRSSTPTSRSASRSRSCSRSYKRSTTVGEDLSSSSRGRKRSLQRPESQNCICLNDSNDISSRTLEIQRKSETRSPGRWLGSNHSIANNASRRGYIADIGKSCFLSNRSSFSAITETGQSCFSPSSRFWRERRRRQHRADAELLSGICRDPDTRRKLKGVEIRLEALFEGTRVTALMETLSGLAVENVHVHMRQQLQQHDEKSLLVHPDHIKQQHFQEQWQREHIQQHHLLVRQQHQLPVEPKEELQQASMMGRKQQDTSLLVQHTRELRQHKPQARSPCEGLWPQPQPEVQQKLPHQLELPQQAKQHEAIHAARKHRQTENRALHEVDLPGIDNDNPVCCAGVTVAVTKTEVAPVVGCGNIVKTQESTTTIYSSNSVTTRQAEAAVRRYPAEPATVITASTSGALAPIVVATTSAAPPAAAASFEGRRCACSPRRARGDSGSGAPRLRLLRLSNQTLTLQDILVAAPQEQQRHECKAMGGEEDEEEEEKERYKRQQQQGLQLQPQVHHPEHGAEPHRHEQQQQLERSRSLDRKCAAASTLPEPKEAVEVSDKVCVSSSELLNHCYKDEYLEHSCNCDGGWCSVSSACHCMHCSSFVLNSCDYMGCTVLPSAPSGCCCCCYRAACSCYSACFCCWRLVTKVADNKSISCYSAGDFTLNSSGRKILQSLKSFVEAYPTLKRIEATVPSFLFDEDEVEGFHEEPEQLHVLDLLLHVLGFCRRRDRRAVVETQMRKKGHCNAMQFDLDGVTTLKLQKKEEPALSEQDSCGAEMASVTEAVSNRESPSAAPSENAASSKNVACRKKAVSRKEAPANEGGAFSKNAPFSENGIFSEEAASAGEAVISKVEPSSTDLFRIKPSISIEDPNCIEEPTGKEGGCNKEGALGKKAASTRKTTARSTNASLRLNGFTAGAAETDLEKGAEYMNIYKPHCYHCRCRSSPCYGGFNHCPQRHECIHNAGQQLSAGRHSRRERPTVRVSETSHAPAYEAETSHASLSPSAAPCAVTDATGFPSSVPAISVDPIINADDVPPVIGAAAVSTGNGLCTVSGPTCGSGSLSIPASVPSLPCSTAVVVSYNSAASSASTHTSNNSTATSYVGGGKAASSSTAVEISAYKEVVVYYRLTHAERKKRCCCCCYATQHLHGRGDNA